MKLIIFRKSCDLKLGLIYILQAYKDFKLITVNDGIDQWLTANLLEK